MQLDVRRSPTMAAAIRVMATLPREVSKETRKYMKLLMVPEWKQGLNARARTRAQQERIAKGANAYVSDSGVRLVAGSARTGSLTKQEEFGANRFLRTTYQRRTRKSGMVKVTRRAQAQFQQFDREGMVAYPTARNLIPRIAALFVQTAYRTTAERVEKDIR